MATDRARQKKLQKKREKQNQKRKQLKQEKRSIAGENAKLDAIIRKLHPLKHYPYWEDGITGLAHRMESPWASASAYADDAVASGEIELPPEIWTTIRARVLPDDAIFESLTNYGVTLDAARFVAEAANFRGAARMVDGLYPEAAAAPIARDHIIAALTALWERWIPERPSDEFLQVAWDRFCGKLVSDKDMLDDWVTFAEALLPTLTPEDGNFAVWVEAFGGKVEAFSTEISGLAEELLAAARSNEDVDDVLDLLRAFLDQFSSEPAFVYAWMEWAKAMERMERKPEAMTALLAQFDRAPEQAAIAHTIVEMSGARTPDADAHAVRQAVEVLQRAISAAEPDEVATLTQTLAEVTAAHGTHNA